jgi:hypothetical protein
MLAGLTNVPYPLYGFGSRSADPYHWITDPDPDVGRIPKTYFGFYGSGTPVEIKVSLICLAC